MKAAAEVLELPQRISGFAKVKGGSTKPLRLIKAANGMTPVEMARQKEAQETTQQEEKPNLITRVYQSIVNTWQESVTEKAARQEKIDRLQHTADSLVQVTHAIATKDRSFVNTQPITCLEQHDEKPSIKSFLVGGAGGPDDEDEQDVLKENKNDAFTDQQKADLAETLMGKKVRIGHVVFDMSLAFADNGTDISKPVPRDFAMLLGVFEKMHGAKDAATFLTDTLKAPIDDSQEFSIDDGAGVTARVQEYAEYIAHCLEINKTIFSDTPTKPAAKTQRTLPAPQLTT